MNIAKLPEKISTLGGKQIDLTILDLNDTLGQFDSLGLIPGDRLEVASLVSGLRVCPYLWRNQLDMVFDGVSIEKGLFLELNDGEVTTLFEVNDE